MTTSHSDTDTNPFAPLHDEQFIVLTTFRASGAPVPTTVWFAHDDGKIYITTNSILKKVGRISANPRVLLAPSDRVGNTHGPAIEARARLLDPAEFAPAEAALRAKYGEQYAMITSQMDASMPPNSRIFIEVRP